MTILSEKEIRAWVENDAVFFRGKEYWLQKRVKAFDQTSAGRINAKVLGSQTYTVDIRFVQGEIVSRCTCPYEWGVCKHVVAVLLQWSHQSSVAAVVPATLRGLPPSRLDLIPLAASKFAEKRLSNIEQLLVQSIARTVRVRVELTSLSTINFTTKGTKAKIKIIEDSNQTASEIYNVRDFVDRSLSHGGDLWGVLNESQRYFLNLLASFQHPYQEMFLRPFQLSILLNTFASLDGVELYAGVKRPIEVCRDQELQVHLDLSLTKQKKLKANVVCLYPQDPLQAWWPNLIDGRPMWCWLTDENKFRPVPKVVDKPVISELGFNTPVIFGKKDFPRILKIADRFKAAGLLRCDPPELEKMTPVVLAPSFGLRVNRQGNGFAVHVSAGYGNTTLSLSDMLERTEFIVEEKEGVLTSVARDLQQEIEFLRFLVNDCGLQSGDEKGSLTVTDDDHMAELLYTKLPKMANRCAVTVSAEVQDIFHVNDVLEPLLRVGTDFGMDWLDYDIGFTVNGRKEQLAFKDLQRQLMLGKNYVRLDSGEFVRLVPEKYQHLDGFIKEYGDGKSNGRLMSAHLPSLLSSSEGGRLPVQLGAGAKEFCEKLKQFRAIVRTEAPPEFKGELRDYQSRGLDWLEFLREFQFGGILADDMGLGKTVQVLALLSRRPPGAARKPDLVVCPTTLVLNWQAEIKKFAPHLKLLVVTGKDRRVMFQNMDEYDLVLTSYALIRRDSDLYNQKQFYYVVLDEAQHIKNRHTIGARMAKSLHSAHRLVLTGTPMENSIADVWSLFDFLMPGYLGRYESFRDLYELPIALGNDPEQLKSLSQKIRPFLLRRLKKDVIKELPPKIEQVSFCEMESVQKRAYAAMADLARRQVMDAFKAKGFEKSRMLILTVLLRLRQICCHPSLAGVNTGSKLSVSAKLNLLKELLDEALSADHRVLIFSQFVEMLDIIAIHLTKEKITFEQMDGRSRHREEIIGRFQEGKVQVFLLSLKVGGVGLNLTGADTVILFDPWWNPAVEDQAIDRVHRIGQQKQVSSYKLICKGTIEEKMLELQKRKKNLVDSLIVAEETIGKKLGWEDVKFLLDL